jgi:hypothetical protein
MWSASRPHVGGSRPPAQGFPWNAKVIHSFIRPYAPSSLQDVCNAAYPMHAVAWLAKACEVRMQLDLHAWAFRGASRQSELTTEKVEAERRE